MQTRARRPAPAQPAAGALVAEAQAIQLRLLADTLEDLRAAQAQLRRAYGAGVLFGRPLRGRRGSWIVYGLLAIEGGAI